MLEDFYEIVSSCRDDRTAVWQIRLNACHEIFRVHFPGTPITPGACQLEIFRQLAGRFVGKSLAIVSIKNLKYLQIIDPGTSPEIKVSESFEKAGDAEEWKATVLVTSGDSVFTKAIITLRSE